MVDAQLLYTFVVYSLILHQEVLSQTDHTLISDKIVGGEEIDIRDQPSQVYVLSKKQNGDIQCGGVILDKTHILTTARCVYESLETKVRVGISDLDESLTDHPFLNVTYIIHEKYEPSSYDYDIALLTLEEALRFSSTVKPITLAEIVNDLDPSVQVTATGWGSTSDNGPMSRKLRSVQIEITDRNFCKDFVYTFLNMRMLCAGMTTQNSCQGDYGGPLVLDNGYLVGLTSFITSCEKAPGVFVNLVNQGYRDWLQNKLSG